MTTLHTLDIIAMGLYMLAGGSSAVVWAAPGEPYGFAASYAGWVVGLPMLVIVSLATEHGAEENPELSHQHKRCT
jgi:hypothetical protein